jgi:hypothetical protein
MATIIQQTIQPPVIFTPAASFATPAVYLLNGKQYIVVAAAAAN